MNPALIVIDMQQAFLDPVWGTPNNPGCERNVCALIAHWRQREWPIVIVRHDSVESASLLRPGQPGNRFMSCIDGPGDVLVTKSVHSAFHGDPDLEQWLRERRIDAIVICGIQTNFCCETTARVGSDLGFDVTLVLDATRTFDLPGITADELTRATAANIAADFGRVCSTADLLDDVQGSAAR